MRKLRLLIPVLAVLTALIGSQATTAHAATTPAPSPIIATPAGATFQGYPVVSVKLGTMPAKSDMTTAEQAALPAVAANDVIDCNDIAPNAYIQANVSGLWWTEEQGYTGFQQYEMRARSDVKQAWQNFALCYDNTLGAYVLWSVANQLWVTAELGGEGATYGAMYQGMLRARSGVVGAWQLFQWRCYNYQGQAPHSVYTDFQSTANNDYVSDELNPPYTGVNADMLRARAAIPGNWEVTDVFNANTNTFWTVCP